MLEIIAIVVSMVALIGLLIGVIFIFPNLKTQNIILTDNLSKSKNKIVELENELKEIVNSLEQTGKGLQELSVGVQNLTMEINGAFQNITQETSNAINQINGNIQGIIQTLIESGIIKPEQIQQPVEQTAEDDVEIIQSPEDFYKKS